MIAIPGDQMKLQVHLGGYLCGPWLARGWGWGSSAKTPHPPTKIHPMVPVSSRTTSPVSRLAPPEGTCVHPGQVTQAGGQE